MSFRYIQHMLYRIVLNSHACIQPNSALDREARKRATTVYLVQRAVPMLPRLLSEELCSLTAGLDKLTFSVVFKMSKDGKILETWFGKSIIK